MLVLTRHIDEVIVIDDNIRITIVGVDGNKVRVGIEAPKEVTVDRLEIAEKKRWEDRTGNARYVRGGR
mgnify:FL=1